MVRFVCLLFWLCAVCCLVSSFAQIGGINDSEMVRKALAEKHKFMASSLVSLSSYAPKRLELSDVKLSNADLDVSESFKMDIQSSTLRANAANYDGNDKNRNLQASFSCQAFPAPSVMSMCSDIVDYSFIIPAGQTLESLETIVRSTVPSTASFLTSPCLSDYKKLRCAEVYKPCVDNVVPDDTSTYVNFLPYKKPCASLCVATSYAGSSCAGIFEALGLSFACTDATQFDTTNTVGQCNSFPNAAAQVVADKTEPYIGATCAGMFSTFIMPNTLSVPGIAPLLGPYVAQMVVEGVINSIVDAVPKYFNENCQIDMRRAYCGTLFNEPQAITSLALMGFPLVYLPKLPAQSICTDYSTTCVAAVAMLPAMAMNCSQKTAGGIALWPSASQVMLSLPTAYPGVTIDLSTDPMAVTPADGYSLPAQCPHGFQQDTFPDIDNRRKSFMMQGVSNCVFSCKTSLAYTPDEAKAWTSKLTATQILSLLIAIPLGFQIYNQESKSRNWFVTIWPMIACASIGLSLIIALATPADDFYAHRCDSEVTYYDQTTTDTPVGFLCAATGGAYILYTIPFNLYVCACLCTEVWLRVVWRVKEMKLIRYCFAAGFWIVIFQGWFNLVFKSTYAEVSSISPFTAMFDLSTSCRSIWPVDNNNPTQALDEVFYPFCAMYGGCMLLIFHLGYVCLTITLNAITGDENVALKLWNTYRTLFTLCMVFIIVGIVTVDNIVSNDTRGEMDLKVSSFTEYVLCIIMGFTSLENDPTGGTAMCGLGPKITTSTSNYVTELWVPPSMFVLILIATYNTKTGKLYWEYTPAFLQKFMLEHVYAQKVAPIDKDTAEKMDEKAVELATMQKPAGNTAAVQDETKDGSNV